MRNSNTSPVARFARIAVLGGSLLLSWPVAQHAQRARETGPTVTGIASRTDGDTTIVTLTADTALTRAQTWQDRDGSFNVVLPRGQTSVRGGRGVQVQRVGDSLQIVVRARPGASVTVQPRLNQLELIVRGGVASAPNAAAAENAPATPAQSAARQRAERVARPSPATRQSVAPARNPAPAREASGNITALPHERASGAPVASEQAAVNAPQANAASEDIRADASINPSVIAEQPAAAPTSPAQVPDIAAQAADEGGLAALLFSPFALVLVLALGLVALLFARRRHMPNAHTESAGMMALVPGGAANGEVEEWQGQERRKGERRFRFRRVDDRVSYNPVETGNGAALQSAGREQKMEARMPAGPAVVFGAYRVDQEVGKLVLGKPHRIDVLASRAPDDRRAVETSLLKALHDAEIGETAQRRACEALEEYGFVARQSASLLLASQSYERAAAARTLGEIKSPSAFPFLLEALYDADSVVRAEAVNSLGEVGMPKAIGALLDLARRHPEMPASLLSKALNACSVETIITQDDWHEDHALSAWDGEAEEWTGEGLQLEPAGLVEQLPEWLEDESLAESLERLESTDVEARTAAAQSLGQFQVRRAVNALVAIQERDPEAGVRAAAITSLGIIGHESVFVPILVGLGDEAREVRAAAARALSRLSFDRADAYVRVIEAETDETLQRVARACVSAGLASQAVDRLTSADRRHAYESFALLALIVKGGETEVLFGAIANHKELSVQMAALRLLGLMGQPDIVPPLRQLATRDGLPEKVRTAILELLYKMEQMQLA